MDIRYPFYYFFDEVKKRIWDLPAELSRSQIRIHNLTILKLKMLYWLTNVRMNYNLEVNLFYETGEMNAHE